MSIRFEFRPQGLFVLPADEREHDRSRLPAPDIRPHESDDASIFEQNPRVAYIIREWRHADEETGCDWVDLGDLHCLSIIWRSGWRVKVVCGPEIAQRYMAPVDRAYLLAERYIARGDERVGDVSDRPTAWVEYEIRLMGLLPKEGLKLLHARLARAQEQAARVDRELEGARS